MYLHYELQKFSHLFKTDLQNVKIADFKNYGVRELLTNSSLLVTDYSSVFFDFAYMRKPIFVFLV
ncbi:MAG: CDP-glycerol glycerophosphotransferase family protein [Clostridiales bacterium]|nr:MAG: CDP-glycerol glycerophosphotransferase family protein [Clostridiales bacterium]